MNHLEMLDDFVNKYESFTVYPKKIDDFPTKQYNENGLCIVILHFGSHLLEKFVTTLSFNPILGMDAQFINNSLRRPLYIFCAQDEHFRTVPGFLVFLGHNDYEHLGKAIMIIKNFIEEEKDIFFPDYIMIDKCDIERKAVEISGARPLLCEFHSKQIFCRKYKSVPDGLRIPGARRSKSSRKKSRNCSHWAGTLL